MKHQSRQENIIYLVLWVMLFMAPILSFYVRSINDEHFTFEWSEVWFIWPKFGVFLLLFLVHNFLLAPLLVHAHKRILYFSTTLCMIALFTIYQCNTRPEEFKRHHHHRAEHRMEPRGDRPDFEHRDGEDPFDAPRKPQHFRRHQGPPPAIIGEHDIISVVILILMFGANLGIKGYYKHRQDQRKLESLQKENLKHQLEYLKYQINPHFFMNTLNNIHALVDIDPEKAKSTIVELSKMMRFILYEGDKNGVPLSRECEFIRTYITLMRLRYTDKVKIHVDLPHELPDKTVPPLMLISFIENAFKHGISYQHDSFIDIRLEVNKGQQLHFTCHNSKADKPNEEKGGIGLANVRQRLRLLYDSNFTLNIQDNPDTYNVELTIPL